MPSSSIVIPPSVIQLISRYRARKAARGFVFRLGVAASVGALLFVASLLIDRFADLSAPLRAAMTSATIIAPALIFLFAIQGLFRRDPIEWSAGELDSATPGARDLLRSSVNFTEQKSGGAAPAGFMLERALEDAQAVGQKVNDARLLRWGQLPLAFLGLLLLTPVIVVIFSTPFMDGSLLLNRFLHPMGNLPRPSLCKIVVDFPAVHEIQQGDDVTIRAAISGKFPADPQSTLLLYPLTGQKSPRVLAVVMNPRPENQFEVLLKNVSEPTSFAIACADGRSERHTIAVKPRPAMTSITAEYTYPRYTMLPSKTEPVTMREFKGVEGTRVRINFESSIPVDKSKAVFPESQMPIRWDKSRTKGSFQFTIEKDSKLAVQLVSDEGTDNRNEAPFRVRLVPDNVPTVSLLGVPEDLSLYRDDLLNLSYKGSDDFGVSEVFIRYHQSSAPRMGRDYTLKSILGSTKQVSGEFSLALRDITGVDDSWVDIELVMVDSKGQEGVSPTVRLQVISNTPDRQLIELIEFQDRYLQSMTRSVNAMRNISSRLAILLDGMDDTTQMSPARKGILDESARAMADIRNLVVTDDHPSRAFLVSEYPCLLQRRTEDLLTRAITMPSSDVFSPLLAAASKNATPRQDVLKLKAAIDAALPAAQAMPAMLRDMMVEGRLTLVSYLCSQFLAQPAAGPKGSSEAATLLAEKQEERLASVAAQLVAIAPGDDRAALRDAATALKDAMAKSGDERVSAVSAAIRQVATQIDGGALDGKLGTATETWLKTARWPTLFQQASDDLSAARTRRAAASWLRLRRDNFVLNTAELFTTTAVLQAAQSGDAGRLSQAIAAAASLEPWVLRSDLFDRAMLLRRMLANMEIEIAAGRVNTKTPAFDQSWREVREVMMSIVFDTASGRFAGISAEVDAALASMTPLSQAFLSWNAEDVLNAPMWNKSREDTIGALDKLTVLLSPSVADGRRQAQALLAPLMQDLAKNIGGEKARIATERAAIQADVEAAAKAPPASNGTMVNGKQRGRIADGARVGFTRDLTDRFTGYAIAAAATADLRQAVWADQPSRESIAELRAMSIVFENLSHLEEDIYDKTYAQHLQQVYGIRPYPGYLEEQGKYLATLDEPINLISNGLTQVAAGKSAALVAEPTFNDSPVRINKHQRFDAQMRSISSQMDFLEGFRAATTDAMRAAMLAPMAKNFEAPTAYWDRVYFATRAVMLQAEAAGSVKEGATWAGVEVAASDAWAAALARVMSVLPPPAEGGDEVKTLRAAIDDFVGLRPKILVTNVAKLDANAKNSAREELIDWRGKLEGAMRAMEMRLVLPAIKTRPRARLMVQRNDLDGTLGRILRNESMWTERVSFASRNTVSTRAQLLSPDIRAVTLADLSFDFSREGSVRRRSAAVSAQASRSLDIDTGGVDASFLKMPKYLYEELRKTLKKPYPSQFKDTALDYTQNLAKDAR